MDVTSDYLYDVLARLIIRGDVSQVEQFLIVDEYVLSEDALRDKYPMLPTDLDIPDRPITFWNPISLAAAEGRADIFDVLVSYGYSPNQTEGRDLPPLHLAAREGHLEMVKRLVEKYGADVNAVVKEVSPLYLAVTDKPTDVLEYLLRHGADPLENPLNIYTGKYFSCPLLLAVRLQYWDTVRTIIPSCVIEHTEIMIMVLNPLLKHEKRDLAYLLYKGSPGNLKGYAFNFPMSLQTLHFLLEVQCAVLLDDFDPWHNPEGMECSYEMMLAAGCSTIRAEAYLKYIDYHCQKQEASKIRERINKLLCSPFSLKDLSTFRIRQCLGKVLPETVDKLPLPSQLKCYIRLEHLLYYTQKSSEQ